MSRELDARETMTENWVYIKSEPGLWTVGFYSPKGWQAESDHDSTESAAERVHYLNGGSVASPQQDSQDELRALVKKWAGEASACHLPGQNTQHRCDGLRKCSIELDAVLAKNGQGQAESPQQDSQDELRAALLALCDEWDDHQTYKVPATRGGWDRADEADYREAECAKKIRAVLAKKSPSTISDKLRDATYPPPQIGHGGGRK